jgi:Zn-dependent peptidase ImmA (M78 family)
MKLYKKLLLEKKKTIESIAKSSGILLSNLLSCISSDRDLSLPEIILLSKHFNLSVSELVSETLNNASIVTLFRDTNIGMKAKIDSLALFINELDKNDSQRKTLYNHYLDDIDHANNPEKLSVWFRNKFYNGNLFSPINNLYEILESQLNINLLIRDIGVDGASFYHNDEPFIVLKPTTPQRMQFTLAHELSHVLVDMDKLKSNASVDNISYNQKSENPEERYANSFASSLLLPREGILSTLNVFREKAKIIDVKIGDIEIIFLSQVYGVNFQVVGFRLENMGLIERGDTNTLYNYIIKNHKSIRNRSESVGLPEANMPSFNSRTSKIFKRILANIENGNISIGKASELLYINQNDLINEHSKYSSNN